MNKFLNWFTEKRLFIIGLVGSVVFLCLISMSLIHLSFNNIISTSLYYIFCISISFIPILVDILIFHFRKDKNRFYSWKKYTLIYLAIYILIITMASWISKYIIALVISTAYLIVSIVYIVLDKDRIISWFTRKKMAIISFLGLLIFSCGCLFDIYIYRSICYGGFCGDISEIFRVYFSPFIPIFIFSIVFLALKDRLFVPWRNFTVYWFIFSPIATSFFPVHTHGMDFVPVTRGLVEFIFIILYSLISLILIIYNSLKKKSA